MANIQSAVARGISTFKVNILTPQGLIDQSKTSPIEFRIDDEAVASFKKEFGQQNYTDTFSKTITGEDVLCWFLTPTNFRVELVRNSFRSFNQ